MNIYTGYDINNKSFISYTKKRDEISTNIFVRKNNGSPDGVYIVEVLPAYALNQYANME